MHGLNKCVRARYTIVFYALRFSLVHAQSDLSVEIIYPREALTITAHDSTFVFGNYSPRTAQVAVNGLRPRQYANGTFLGMVPVHSGQFVFRAVVRRDSTAGSDSAVVIRNVTIPPFLLTSVQTPLTIDTS